MEDPPVALFAPADGTHVCLPGETLIGVRPGGRVAVSSGGLRAIRNFTVDSNGFEQYVEATSCGVFRSGSVGGLPGTDRYDVSLPLLRRYIPAVGDPVIGHVVKILGQSYLLNISATLPGYLNALAFDGATKQNRPKLRIGDVVFCRVVSADSDYDTELTCCATASMASKAWTTDEALFGPLSGGITVFLPQQYCHELCVNVCPMLQFLSKRVSFETCIGLNGRVWVSANGADETTRVTNTIALALGLCEGQEDRTAEQCARRVEALFPRPAEPDDPSLCPTDAAAHLI